MAAGEASFGIGEIVKKHGECSMIVKVKIRNENDFYDSSSQKPI
jgi:hypothetical protein